MVEVLTSNLPPNSKIPYADNAQAEVNVYHINPLVAPISDTWKFRQDRGLAYKGKGRLYYRLPTVTKQAVAILHPIERMMVVLPSKKSDVPLSIQQLEEECGKLGSADPNTLHMSVLNLIANGKQTLRVLQKQIQKDAHVSLEDVAILVKALGDPKYSTRKEATTALTRLGW